jgi:hypothetical protein
MLPVAKHAISGARRPTRVEREQAISRHGTVGSQANGKSFCFIVFLAMQEVARASINDSFAI